MFRSKEQLNAKGRPTNIAFREIIDHAKQPQLGKNFNHYGLVEAVAAQAYTPANILTRDPLFFKDSPCTNKSDCETEPNSGKYIKDDDYTIVDD